MTRRATLSGLSFVLLAILGAAPASALAQAAPTLSYGSKEAAAELAKANQVEWKLGAQAGLILSTGNSRATSLAAGASASRKAHGNKFALEGGLAYARSRIFLALDEDASGTIEEDEIAELSQTSTRSWFAKGRYDRYLTEANSLYGSAGLLADRPAGKELIASGQVGYSREVYKDTIHLLLAELGYDYTHEDLVVGDGVSIHSLRGFVGYAAKLSEETGLDASVEALSNVNSLDTPSGPVDAFEDNRFNGKASLTTKVLADISFRFAFEAHYDNAPAPLPPVAVPYAPGFVPLAEQLDTRTEATLIVNFL